MATGFLAGTTSVKEVLMVLGKLINIYYSTHPFARLAAEFQIGVNAPPRPFYATNSIY